ncbi:MAG: ATP-dependent Clp protease ATP-binding subunit [Bacilli bacterium]|nr:ATP-dependent Clp protease ATP-binding subunit [Bacilli bacterium]
MFSNFDEEARKIIVTAKAEMKSLKHPYVGSEHLLLAILKGNNSVAKKLKEFNLTYDRFKSELIKIVGVGTIDNNLFLFTPLLKRVIEEATLNSREDGVSVSVEYLFKALLEEGEGIGIRIILSMDIELDDLESLFTFIDKKKGDNHLLLDELGVDITEKAIRNELDPVVGRDIEINRILEILSRRCKNNPILIGEAGVGKTAIVEELSRMISSDRVPFNLRNKRIISLDMASLVAGTKYRGEFEDKIKKVLKEVEDNKDIILFIDEIHTLVGAGGAEGAIDASNIIKPALARGSLRCIGATTTQEYKEFIERDRALDRRFQKVLIDEPDLEKTKNILINIKKIYEDFHSVRISNEVIDLIVDLSNKYIYDRCNPDKSLDILDEVCARVSITDNKIAKKYKNLKAQYKDILLKKEESINNNDFECATLYKEKENIITDKINNLELSLYKTEYRKVKNVDVYKVISDKAGIPIDEISIGNKKMLDRFDNLKEYIIGQDDVVEQVIKQIKKQKLGFNDTKVSSYLFVGPSGVGKTMLAKKLASILTKNIIKLDMTEYSEAHSISKIIGAPPGYIGYDSYTNILESIRTNPYSVLILDEIDKAHPDIINLFFNILDEGKIKDSKGRIVRFDNVTIIMTSNVGFNNIQVGFKNDKKRDSNLKESFSIPFLNRIDNVLVFNYIDDSYIKKIIKLKINELISKYHNYNISISDEVVEEIKELSNYKEFGARRIDKIIKDKLVNRIIDNIIEGEKNINICSLIKKTV